MAHPGDLDTSFGSGGKKAINFGGTDAAQAVLVQPNGRVVAAGGGGPASSFCVVRLRAANGTLDPTFGTGGKRIVDFGGDDESVYGAALQPDGKIVLAGDSRLQPAVIRLKANGALDTSFDGDGKKLFSWGAIGRVTAVVAVSNGKILLGGFSGPEGGNIQVARLKANGALDTTFATGGIATVDFGGDDFGEAMVRQADGRIVVTGRSTAAGAVVARLRATGALDPDFGVGGRVTLPGGGSARAVLMQPDGKIVVAGNASLSAMMIVTRLMPNGSPDPTFDGDGTATIDFGSTSDIAAGVVRQPDGKIVVAGYTQASEDVAVARLNPNGSPDTTFGVAGKATVDFGVATFGNAVARAPNGRIVVAGQKTGGDNFAVARLLA
ncbi:MAG TPA: hypothetical protein VFY32_12875 [Solirubrobacteraceae bacterium]|jgi:uncharacterized delta-60 repeat protein|nr:hypothetical protein [Solirubrobacteraceae bacterium]